MAKPSLIQLRKVADLSDERGGLSVIERSGSLPILVRRVYWIYGTNVGVSRGFHAHHKPRAGVRLRCRERKGLDV
jgi:hypothetical protein